MPPVDAAETSPGNANTTLVVVTGLSGAGRSSALSALEDEGFEAVDNLPLTLLPALFSSDPDERPDKIAVGIDVRTRDFGADSVLTQLSRLEALPQLRMTVLYLDCDEDVLIQRYTETRRRHPLAADRPIGDGIRFERRTLYPIRQRADVVIDTSGLTLGAFREILRQQLDLTDTTGMTVTVTSFSFRRGLPREADLVFDVRFLKNPHYQPDLRPLTGLDAAVGAYIEQDPGFAPFFQSLCNLVEPLLPRYAAEGKSYLTIAVGCTGGKHRSVHTAERLAAWLKSRQTPVTLRHRDIPSEQQESQATTENRPTA